MALNGIGADAGRRAARARAPCRSEPTAASRPAGTRPRARRPATCSCSPTTTSCSAPGALERLASVLARSARPASSARSARAGTARTWEHEATVRPPTAIEACDAVSGFLFATRRSTWEAVGGFDEAYAPASWEEVDFNRRGAARLGLRSYAVGGVDAPHEWGISARQPPWRTRALGRPARAAVVASTGATAGTSCPSGPRVSATKAIASIGTGPHERLLRLAARSFRPFARRHGYDLHLAHRGGRPARPAPWSKVPILQRAARRATSRFSGSTATS